jgi:hypothetical protein
MIDFLEFLKEVSPNFVAEAKKDDKGGNPFAKKDGGDEEKGEEKGDKGPSMFAKFAKKKEGGDEKKGDKGGKPEFPANFLKKK